VVTKNKGLVVGLIIFFGTLIGIFMSLLSGILSDHTASRWGKRTPAILIGALIGMPLIGLPALFLSGPWRGVLLPVALPIIIISFCGMQFFTNVGNGAGFGTPRRTDPDRRRHRDRTGLCAE
jgi:Na+/melibiose symporter-like transporter